MKLVFGEELGEECGEELGKKLGEKECTEPVYASFGVFDGVHIGHKAIIEQMLSAAKKDRRKSVVLTFHPHPQRFLRGKDFALITTLEDRVRLIKAMGVESIYIAEFDESLRRKSAFSFLEEVVEMMQIQALFVGSDYRFGFNRAAGVKELLKFAERLGVRVHVVEKVKKGGVFVSSSFIRTLLSAGRVEEASQFLGRAHFVWGTVVQGEGAGTEFGYPTANVAPKPCLLPKDGVYAVLVQIGERLHPGMANIGSCPTLKQKFCVEAHVFDFLGDLYGKRICLHFVQRIRDERRFEGAAALLTQIREDESRARKIFQEGFHEYIKR
jgi:riboflavin kinase/FMN adenylyltransferase